MKEVERKPRAICILGVHRSGTSTVTRAVNLLGAYLGQNADLMPPTLDNPEGYWERLDIHRFHERLLKKLGRTWSTAAPLPDQWQLAEEIRPYREELKALVRANFTGHPLWAWKDPRTCILLPLWRAVLEELGIELSCVFVVRNPLDVANSLRTRDRIPLHQAFGLWFNQNLAALKDAADLPTVFLAYDQFLESWETELRRCAVALALEWPADDQPLKQVMGSFIRPELRHNKSSPERLQGASRPIQTLYAVLSEAIEHPTAPEDRLRDTVTKLFGDFYDYASFFQSGLDQRFVAQVTHPSRQVAFVLSVCNQLDTTVRCLESLARIGVSDSEIVVVDNASTDGTREFLAGRPSLGVLSNRANLGRSAGWNQGVQAAGATWTVILTPEVILAPGFREGLINFAEKERCDLVSPAIGEGELDYELSSFAEMFVKTMGRACRYGMAWSCSFMVHRRVFDRVGLFDPEIQPAGAKAEDFFRRARAAGFRLAVTGRAYLHHCDAMPPSRLMGRMEQPNCDHRESRKAHRLTWLPRRLKDLRGKVQAALWRFNERRHFGMTLRMKHSQGRWHFA